MTPARPEILILTRTRNGLKLCHSEALDDIRRQGAVGITQLTEPGVSDPAVAAQAIATRALHHPEPFTHVLWLDDDIVASTGVLVAHAELCNELKGSAAAISGRFVNRYNPQTLAATGDPIHGQGELAPDMPIIWAGLGCLMLTAEHFRYATSRAPQNHGDGRRLVCAGTFFRHPSTGEQCYRGEDYDYSARLRDWLGLPVALGPRHLRYGHEVSQVVWPAL